MADCNVRHPTGPVRCEKERGHRDEHAFTAALIADVEAGPKVWTWPNRHSDRQGARTRASAPKRRTPLKPGSPPKQESDKQKDKKKLWAFIKRCFILCQQRTDGYTSCMQCGRQDPPRIELDHIDPAGRGGLWTPGNAQLLCGGPGSCHERKHGTPQFSSQRKAQ